MNKTIWILWMQGYDNAPSIVKKCISSWVVQNPDWQVNILNRDVIVHYVELDLPKATLNRLSVQHYADLIRVALLSRHGGVWADATLYCRQPLDDWLHKNMDSGFFAFSRESPKRVSSSWFLAANAGNVIPVKLYEAMKDYWLTYSRFTYKKPRIGIWRKAQKKIPRMLLSHKNKCAILIRLIQKKHIFPPYFLINDLFSDLLIHDETFRDIWNNTPVFLAAGPLLVARIGYISTIDVLSKRSIENSSAPLFKLSWKKQNADNNPDSVIAYMESIMPEALPSL